MTITWSNEIGFGPNGTYEFPDNDGVYVIAQIIDGTAIVRYVGKGNIYDRMEAHKDWKNEQNECLADVMKDTSNVKVRSAIISDPTERANVEYTFYKHYLDNGHSLCNKIEPEGSWLSQIPLPF